MAIGQKSTAQIYYHDFGTTTISSYPYNIAPVTFNSHLSNSSWTNSIGSWTSNTGATGEAIRLTTATSATITLTFDVASNFQAEITSFNFWRQRSNFGPQNWSMTINGINAGSGTIGTTGASIGATNVSNAISGLSGTVTVVISLTGATGNGTFRLDDFTLNGSVTSSCIAPVVTSFTPVSGPQNTLVTINGSGFQTGTGTSSVKFNGIETTSFTVVSNTQIKAYIPSGNASGNISITTNGCEGISTGSFIKIISQAVITYTTDIYISEVYDAYGGDRGVIELYNGTASTVNLAGYSIGRYGNIGNSSPDYSYVLTGSIPSLTTFLIHVGNNGTFPTPCGLNDNGQILGAGFNANDEFKLFKNSVVIDDVQAPNSIGYSMTRNLNAVAPKIIFNNSDWGTQFNTNNCEATSSCHCSDLGVHNVPTPVLPVVTSPSSKVACENGTTSFSAMISNSAGYTYQWKVVGTSGIWVNVTNGGSYSGANTNTLTINPALLTFDDNQYYCQISSPTVATVISNAAQLQVNALNITPTFVQVSPICSGGTMAALPTTSIEGITGAWSPALNNTVTTTYSFTPNPGQCALPGSMTITVSPKVTPTFTQIAPICSGNTLSALPTTSIEGITGTWSPALNNTSTTIYSFLPNTGQCSLPGGMTITVSTSITPTFTQTAPICSGGALSALPTTSIEGITGTWSPALNNTSTTTYSFAPNNGQCSLPGSMTIAVSPQMTPTFTQVSAICSGTPLSALPTTSIEGITGTWSPALNNTSTTVYTFTPTAGQCSLPATMTITVNQKGTPTFAQVNAICSGDTLAALPTTSIEGITGAWSPALNNTSTTVYTFTPTAGQCALPATMTITVNQKGTPTFTQVNAICSGTPLSALPTTSIEGITGAWSPALNNTSTTVYTFTPTAGQCALPATMTITVNQKVTPTFTQVNAICSGDTLAALPRTSIEGITGAWSPGLNNTSTTVYTFTPTAGQCSLLATMTITVNQKATPTFTQVNAICSETPLLALPTTSIEGITGAWSPALNNTSTTVYTFTPTAGQCALPATMTITVNQKATPTFTQVNAICSETPLLALPTTSIEGITGTWSPALNNTSTTVYTFTPTAGQCSLPATMTITVNQKGTPTFTQVSAICSGGTLTALPTTSIEGITGAWSPALNNTSTTVYTFTPTAGQCALPATMTITVNQKATPTFTQVSPICSGGTLSALPTTSIEGITGTWSPALDNTVTTTYNFQPALGQCAFPASMTIAVSPKITPTFAQIVPICSGGTLSALPTTSIEGITGTWSPALDNTATTTYNFQPFLGQCSLPASMTITVNQKITPTFTQVNSICSGGALSALPTTSIEGITGTWTPALDNTATTTYNFQPSVGQCALPASMTITVNQKTTPTFVQVAPICSGVKLSSLPTTSIEGITGTWSPALDNTVTATYNFTADPGQCALSASMTITVNQKTTPTFAKVNPICSGGMLSSLPTTSIEGIMGTWSPALDNTATTTYSFIPDNGQCAIDTNMTIIVRTPPEVKLEDKYLCVDKNGAIISTVDLNCGAFNNDYSYVWTLDNITLPTTTNIHTATVTGNYKVTVTDNITGCSTTVMAKVGISSIAIADATVGNDFNANQTITINVTGGSGVYEFQLDDGYPQASNQFNNVYDGEYNIIVRDKRGCGELYLTVYALNYPRFFTPNGDGVNDVWNIDGLYNQPKAKIYIFDRYGKLITSVKPSSGGGWDGTYNGEALPSTDYWFTMNYKNKAGIEKELKAHFSLKR